MKVSTFIFIIVFLALSMALRAEGINVEQTLLKHNQKIKQLINSVTLLSGYIEELQYEQQKNIQKIKELITFIDFKILQEANKREKLQIEKHKQNAYKNYKNAQKLLISGKYQKAVEAFNQYIENYPQEKYIAEAHYWLAKSYLKIKNYKNAQKYFMKFIKENSSHVKIANSLYELVGMHIKLGELVDAKEKLTLMSKKFPNHSSTIKAMQLMQTIK